MDPKINEILAPARALLRPLQLRSEPLPFRADSDPEPKPPPLPDPLCKVTTQAKPNLYGGLGPRGGHGHRRTYYMYSDGTVSQRKIESKKQCDHCRATGTLEARDWFKGWGWHVTEI